MKRKTNKIKSQQKRLFHNKRQTDEQPNNRNLITKIQGQTKKYQAKKQTQQTHKRITNQKNNTLNIGQKTHDSKWKPQGYMAKNTKTNKY